MKKIPVEEKMAKIKITGNVGEKARPILTKIMVALDKGEIDFEEYDPIDDGTFIKTEYCGTWKKIDLTIIKEQKTKGINPRFKFNIFLPKGDTIQLHGEVAALANKIMNRNKKISENSPMGVSDESLDELNALIGD